jgi:hypothetical protein
VKIIAVTSDWPFLDDWRFEHRIPLADILVVRGGRDLYKIRGQQGLPYVRLGAWYDLPDWREIEAALAHQKAIEWKPREDA